VATVTILGAGAMGSALATPAVAAGNHVLDGEPDAAALLAAAVLPTGPPNP
jgi:predicted dinucleotide-binding enzyme